MKTHVQIGNEVSITGKWVPKSKSGIFRKSENARELLKEWESIHDDARKHNGMLSTEINHAIGQDTVLVHHIFENHMALAAYFLQTAGNQSEALCKVARPDYHLVRGMKISQVTLQALQGIGVNGNFGAYSFGFVRNDYLQPDTSKAIQVTTKWTCKQGESVDELKHG